MDLGFSVIQNTDPNWLAGPQGPSSDWEWLPHTLTGAPAGGCIRTKVRKARASKPRKRSWRALDEVPTDEFVEALSLRGPSPAESPIPVLQPGSKAEMRRLVRPPKRAALLDDEHIVRVINHINTCSRSRESDLVKFLLSCKAGLRAGEIAELAISSCTDAERRVGESLTVSHKISKSKRTRTLPIHPALGAALEALREQFPEATHVAFSIGRGGRLRRQNAAAVTNWLCQLYKRVGLSGCSSHSGRRTFATKAARRLATHHCSLEDVQRLLGHEQLSSTQCYLEPSPNLAELVHAL